MAAVMPQSIVKRCVLAGTSAHGACAECGAPYRRAIDSQRTLQGWEPTCACNGTAIRPCLVLDPFFGSGTVGLVAEDLGRLWLGCDLNPEYERIQRQRTAQRGLGL